MPRYGDAHDMKTLLEYSCLPRLVDATLTSEVLAFAVERDYLTSANPPADVVHFLAEDLVHVALRGVGTY
eukprot:6474184-Amphidinium_carterae.1